MERGGFINKTLRAVEMGAIAGAITCGIVAFKSLDWHSLVAIFIQWIITSLLITYLPMKVQGFKKGVIIGVFCVLPLSFTVSYFDPAGSVIAGLILYSLFGGLIGAYVLYDEKK